MRGSFAHVATSLDSLQSFTFEPASESDSSAPMYTELGRVCSDGQARSSASILPISFDTPPDTTFSKSQALSSASSPYQSGSNTVETTEIILLSDKAGSIAGLHFAPDKRIANAAPLLFEATFSRSIIVLRRGNVRPPWRRSHFNTRNHNKNEPRNMHQREQAQDNDQWRKPQGVLVDDIIGSATDGTVMAGTVVDEHAWRLLSFLTRACQPLSQYYKSGSHSLDINIDPDDDVAGLRRKLAYHINGDILARILESREENEVSQNERKETGNDPVQILIDAIDGRVCYEGDDVADDGHSKGYRKDTNDTLQTGSAEYKSKKEHIEKVRKIRAVRWKRFNELVREALPDVLEELETSMLENNDDQFKNRTDDNSSGNNESKKEEGAKDLVNSGKPNDDNDDEDDEYDDGTMEIEEAQFEMDAHWRDGSERTGNEDERKDEGEGEEEKAQVRERKRIMGVVVNWLRAVLMTLD